VSCGTQPSGSRSTRPLTQSALLARHAGASRFTYNQSLRLVTDALAAAQAGLSVTVPWSEFDLIKAFNAWKISESAGRVFVVAPDGTATKTVTGLPWRHQVSAQALRKPPSTSGGRSLHTPEAGTGG
jgi:putative transposase